MGSQTSPPPLATPAPSTMYRCRLHRKL